MSVTLVTQSPTRAQGVVSAFFYYKQCCSGHLWIHILAQNCEYSCENVPRNRMTRSKPWCMLNSDTTTTVSYLIFPAPPSPTPVLSPRYSKASLFPRRPVTPLANSHTSSASSAPAAQGARASSWPQGPSKLAFTTRSGFLSRPLVPGSFCSLSVSLCEAFPLPALGSHRARHTVPNNAFLTKGVQFFTDVSSKSLRFLHFCGFISVAIKIPWRDGS